LNPAILDKGGFSVQDNTNGNFIKMASIGAAALAASGAALMTNNAAASVSSVPHEEITTDVLVIGGGIAGIFAAIKAKEKGADVVLADKGTVGKSGMSPWFGAYAVYYSFFGMDNSVIKSIARGGEYLVNIDYVKMFLEDSKDRYEDLASWGAAKSSKQGRGLRLREQVVKNDIRLLERTMITELLETDGKVTGAAGFPMEEDRAVIIKAKAVILCTGSGTFKTPGFPASSLTHDGDAMAYRIGADISGKEFIDFHWTHWKDPADVYSNWESEWGKFSKNSFGSGQGGNMSPVGHSMQAHSGNMPVYMSGPGGNFAPPGCRSTSLPIVGGSTAGMAPHKCEGIFPKDDRFGSSVPGLFAAGDALCTGGAVYSGGPGSSSSESAVQGGRAGIYAAEYAMNTPLPNVSEAQINSVIKSIFEPRLKEKGYSPEWLTQVIQVNMVPYYVLYIKNEKRLKAALTTISFLREHFQDNLLADDTHKLRLAHETRNMLLNAEMKLKASLFRTESRGAHYREDFPAKDDKNWIAWIIISRDGENMKLTKKPVPEGWRS
jgi:succinate dehydrogenase/fumarate reductase flavoprotein subunit